MAENPRTTTARDTDDHELIDAMVEEGGADGSSSGGRLQTDVGSQDDLNRAIGDPEGRTRPMKDDDIASDQAHASDRRGHSG